MGSQYSQFTIKFSIERYILYINEDINYFTKGTAGSV